MGRKLARPSGNWSYVYALVDPETKRVRYIGATTDVTGRYQSHVSTIAFHMWIRARARDNTPPPVTAKVRWVYSLLERGLRPELRVLARAPGRGASRLEPKFIRDHIARGEPLFNVDQNPNGGHTRIDPLDEV